MSGPDPHAPLPRTLLGQLGDRPARAAADPELLARDIAVLSANGYLTLAVPTPLGGAGFSLRQVACAQRQLAARAPAAALAVTAHHAWAGAAADTLASADPDDTAAQWVLREAARGRFFAGHPGQPQGAGQPGGAVCSGCPGPGERPGRTEAGEARTGGEALMAGVFGWALPLTGMAWYAVARQAFGLAVERPEAGHPLDRWAVAEASLRLDTMREQLDETIDGWQQRTAAGGALTSLDPGHQWLIRLFTVRHAATSSAQRVIELAAQIAGERAAPAELMGPAGPMGPVGPVRA